MQNKPIRGPHFNFYQSQAMFTAGLAETVQDVVTLNGVEPGMISGLLDYAYTGQITITKHNVQSMLSAANLLEILPVRDACCQVRLLTCSQKLSV